MELKTVPLAEIQPNPFQARRQFDEETLGELAESLRSVGEIQPIIVRRFGRGYQIIAGERRWRAAKLAGLREIPVLIRQTADDEVLLESVVENLHRKDLESAERESAIESLWMTGKWKTYAEMGKALGKSEHWIQTNLEAASIREKENIPVEVATRTIVSTASLESEERRRIIERVRKEEITEKAVREYVRVVKKAPEPVKQELLKSGSFVTPKMAETIVEELPDKREQSLVLGEIKRLRLTEDEVESRVKEIQRTENGGRKIEPLKSAYQTLDEPLQLQYQNQRLWNLKQLIGRDLSQKGKDFRFDFVTVGYSQKSLQDVINSLKAADVTLVIDVRKNPMSLYKPDFNKNILERDLPRLGMKYEHIPDLGVPRQLRDMAYEGRITPQEVFQKYEKEILTNDALARIERLSKGHRTIAFLCTEVNPKMCHRHKIAEALTKMGKIGYDL